MSNRDLDEVIKTLIAQNGRAITFLTPPLSDRLPQRASRGARDPPSQGHGWSPAALHQMPRCTADSRASIGPGQFSFSPEVDAELPVVPRALY
eukprot:scaffold12159_cov58-Phaeocystis_antarctica.AAC.1